MQYFMAIEETLNAHGIRKLELKDGSERPSGLVGGGALP